MKALWIFAILILAVTVQAQTVPTGLKTVGISGTNITFVTQDSLLMGQRYAQRNNLLGPFVANDTLNAFAHGRQSVICPPLGFSQQYVDSVKAVSFRAGQNTPATKVQMMTPDSTFNYIKQ